MDDPKLKYERDPFPEAELYDLARSGKPGAVGYDTTPAVYGLPVDSWKNDAWENPLTGVGTRDRDKAQSMHFRRPTDLTFDWMTLQSLYHFDPLSRRIVDTWPKHMFRNGWDLATTGPVEKKPGEQDDRPDWDVMRGDALPLPGPGPGSKSKPGELALQPGAKPLPPSLTGKPLSPSGQKKIASGSDQYASVLVDIEDEAERLRLAEAMYQAYIWGRLYGGAILIIGANDGSADLSKPLDEEDIRSIDYLTVVDNRYVTTAHYYADYQKPNYGEPEVYRVFRTISDVKDANSQSMFEIHESRVIRFEGEPVDIIERQRLRGWSHSVLQAPYEEIKRFMQTFQSASHLLTDASQGVYKLKGLMQQLATKGGQQLLNARMQMMDMARSVARSLLIDADGEEFARIQTSFASIPELLDRFMQMLSMVTGIPVTILMGRSAAGMNATGDSDFRAFYGEVAAEQSNNLKPKLKRAYKLMMLAREGPTKGKEYKLNFDFRPLWNPTDKERAETNYIQAQADALYVKNQIATAEEIAISRFRNGRMNLNTVIDVEGREGVMKDGKAFIEPPPPPTIVAPPGQDGADTSKSQTGFKNSPGGLADAGAKPSTTKQ